jgi:hypothetical protein
MDNAPAFASATEAAQMARAALGWTLILNPDRTTAWNSFGPRPGRSAPGRLPRATEPCGRHAVDDAA